MLSRAVREGGFFESAEPLHEPKSYNEQFQAPRLKNRVAILGGGSLTQNLSTHCQEEEAVHGDIKFDHNVG